LLELILGSDKWTASIKFLYTPLNWETDTKITISVVANYEFTVWYHALIITVDSERRGNMFWVTSPCSPLKVNGRYEEISPPISG
jgi:hypothetical protein